MHDRRGCRHGGVRRQSTRCPIPGLQGPLPASAVCGVSIDPTEQSRTLTIAARAHRPPAKAAGSKRAGRPALFGRPRGAGAGLSASFGQFDGPVPPGVLSQKLIKQQQYQCHMAEGEELGSNLLHVAQRTPANSGGRGFWQGHGPRPP
jgi:hypothetical protein